MRQFQTALREILHKKLFFSFQICLHSRNHSLYSCGPDNDLCFRSLLVWITTKSFSFQASKCDLISWLKTGSLFLHFSGQLTSSLVRLQCTVDNLVDNFEDNFGDSVDIVGGQFGGQFWWQFCRRFVETLVIFVDNLVDNFGNDLVNNLADNLVDNSADIVGGQFQ